MSTVVRPSGRLPARVYWVRRLLLIAIVLGLVWGVVRLVGGSDPASGEPSSSDSSSDAADAEDATASSPAPEAEKTRRAPTHRDIRQRRIRAEQARQAELRRLQRVQDVTPALSSPAGPCDLTQVLVDAQIPEPAYAGTAVAMRVELRTQQPAACTLDLTAERLLLSVVSGEATVWTTSRCPDAIPRRTVVLRPSWTSTVDVEWSARTSGRRCSATGDFAAPGDYELRLAALTGEPASVPFALVDPAPVAPPTADNEPQEDAEADELSPGDGAGEASPDSPDSGEPPPDDGGGEESPESLDSGDAGAGPAGENGAGQNGVGQNGDGARGNRADNKAGGDDAGGNGEAGDGGAETGGDRRR